MVADPTRSGGERPLRVLPMRPERIFRLSPRAEARLQEFCRLTELDEDFAVQVLIAHGLHCLQAGLALHLVALEEPRPEPPQDHKRGVD